MKAIVSTTSLSFLVCACVHTQQVSPLQPEQPQTNLEARYRAAVTDAATAEPAEISTTLQPIADWNPRLQWKGEPGARRVLVSTWTSYGGYDDKIGQSLPTTRELFVTAAPEVKDFCRALRLSGTALSLRLEQYLGLPPNNGKTKFVEMWASPNDLFRPCPDPAIDDKECGIDFPHGRYTTTADDYRAWFEDLKSKSYGDKGYPWTRLGYTYDWGAANGKFGASEYVIRSGATIEIAGVTPTAEYCK